MNSISKITLTTITLLTLGAVSASADVAKGQKLFTKKLKSSCHITGAAMAAKHTQGQWSDIFESGKLVDEIKTICPDVKEGSLKEKYLKDYYDFFKEYGSDSGNVPSC